MECIEGKVWTPGLIGDVYHLCDQFEYTQPDGIVYSDGFGCYHNHGYITPSNIKVTDGLRWCIIMANGRMIDQAYTVILYGILT